MKLRSREFSLFARTGSVHWIVRFKKNRNEVNIPEFRVTEILNKAEKTQAKLKSRQAETAFKAMKSDKCNTKDTHLTQTKRTIQYFTLTGKTIAGHIKPAQFELNLPGKINKLGKLQKFIRNKGWHHLLMCCSVIVYMIFKLIGCSVIPLSYRYFSIVWASAMKNKILPSKYDLK